MTTCHGCNQPLEPLAAIRIYHGGCDPWSRMERLHAALANVASIAAFEQEHPTDLHMTAFSLIEKAARAAISRRPVQWKGRE